jgi:hypothetical protein
MMVDAKLRWDDGAAPVDQTFGISADTSERHAFARE